MLLYCFTQKCIKSELNFGSAHGIQLTCCTWNPNSSQVSSPRSVEVWSLKKISCPSRCPLVSQEVLQNQKKKMITIKIQLIQSLKPKTRKFTTPKCCFQGHHPSSQGLQARVRGQTESLWGSRVVDVIRSSMVFQKRRTKETLPPTHTQNISKSAKIKHMFSTFSAFWCSSN